VEARAGKPEALRRVKAPGQLTKSRLRSRAVPALWHVLVLLGGLALGAPVRAADPPALKETLGKVQSDADAKAVEDLIDKLKGVSRKPAPAAPTPSAAPVAPTPASPAGSAPAPSGPPPGQSASPARPEGPVPAIRPDEAVKRAESSQAPSIDLEIFFEYNSAEITPRAAAALTPLGRALSDARLADDAFLIAGHSDGKGGGDYNLALSQKRADAVRRYLIATFGIDGAKLVATGMGSKHLKNVGQPLAAENRRVQIVNLSKDERAKPGQR